jgi:hypothetical protein
MSSDALLVVLIGAGSALSWWPVIMEPSLNFPWWLPLGCIALGTGLATTLSNEAWLRIVVASVVGTFAGLCIGYTIWWPTDGIKASYVGPIVIVATLVTALLSLVSGGAVRKVLKLQMSNETARRFVWLMLVSLSAFGPAAVSLTRPLVEQRVAQNDRLATERFASLKRAVEEAVTAAGDARHTCDGSALRRFYNGPPFTNEDWERITGNYVLRDGYSYMVYCREKGGYTIDVNPFGGRAEGTRRFCTDESNVVGCGMEWDGSRHACVPCPK